MPLNKMNANTYINASTAQTCIEDFKSALENYGMHFHTSRDATAQYWKGWKYLNTNNKLCVDLALNNISHEVRMIAYGEDARMPGRKTPLLSCAEVNGLVGAKEVLIHEFLRQGVLK